MGKPKGNEYEELVADHSLEAIRTRLDAGPEYSYLKDFIYGAIDGAVTTFAVVSAVAGSGLSGAAGTGLSSGIVIILGVANLLGDGFSMGASNFLGSRADEQEKERERRSEQRHIEIYPEGEREEIREIFRRKGFEGEDLEQAVKVITSDVNRWIDTMMVEQHGYSGAGSNPLKAAAVTFGAFVLVGSVPLLAFFGQVVAPGAINRPYLLSVILTASAFFVVGAVKARVVGQRWYWGGMETLLVGGLAASIAYFAGVLMKDLQH